jgi:signal peptide peptidase SppA
MTPYQRILRAVYSVPWAIQPEKLEAILAFLELKASGQLVDPATLAGIQAASLAAAARAAAGPSGAVAVLPLYGIISHRANMMSDVSGPRGTSTEKFTQAFRAAIADPNVSAIVIDVDSPGGTTDGVAELADEIFKARGKKPMTAVANTQMASAAYWIASSADELVATPSSTAVGSIGVYLAHQERSKAIDAQGVKTTLISAGKYKTEGNPFEPLTDDARQAFQSLVDENYGMFTRAVARARNVKADDVRNGYGQGRAVSAQQALKLGMIDRVATLDQVLGKYGVSRSAGALKAEAQALDDEDAHEPIAPAAEAIPEIPEQQDGEREILLDLERHRLDLA